MGIPASAWRPATASSSSTPSSRATRPSRQSGIAWDEATKGVTHVALTHGHSDHVGDAGEICRKRGAPLFANFELAMYMKIEGRGEARADEHRRHGGDRRFRAHARQCAALLLAGRLSRQSQRHHRPPQGGQDALSHGRHRHVRRHGADRRVPQARDRHRADRRPLHHGRAVGGVHLQEVLRLRDDPALLTTGRFRACWIPTPTSSLPR